MTRTAYLLIGVALGGALLVASELLPGIGAELKSAALVAFSALGIQLPTKPSGGGKASSVMLVLLLALPVPLSACGGNGLSDSLRDAHDRVDGYRQAIADECGTDFSEGACAAVAAAYEQASVAYARAVEVVAAFEDGEVTVEVAVRAVAEAEQAVARVRELGELLK